MSEDLRHITSKDEFTVYWIAGIGYKVRPRYYLASCDECGWIGSSEDCGVDTWGDDSDVYCPKCRAAGADCGEIARKVECAERQQKMS